MLFTLNQPLVFVTLVVSFVVAVVLRSVVQALTRRGDWSGRRGNRLSADPREHVDPFGAIGAAIGGIGWGRPHPLETWRGRPPARAVLGLLAGPFAVIVAGLLFVLAFRLAGGGGVDVPLSDILLGQVTLGGDVGQRLLYVAGIGLLSFGLLALVPIPPLDGGQVLFAYAPRTGAWQKADYYLRDQNWGVAVLLALLLLPLGGRRSLLLFLVDLVGQPLVALVTGAS